MIRLPENDWRDKLRDEFEQPYMQQLMKFLNEKYEHEAVYPPKELLFHALHLTAYEDAKVVILGQDPYHGEGQAHGLSFSVQKGVKLPPSLRNIYKELEEDAGVSSPEHGFLESWASQGVLLLNAVLTVEKGKPASHQKLGWERFTDKIIELLNERETPIVFILWGNYAQEKAGRIDRNKHLVIASAHPSPFAARKGFFGSKPFSKSNEFLMQQGLSPIQWHSIDEKGGVLL
ncbi:uracil-DNA glycosylase [Paenibacillus sp. GCM10027627]|uniref:uracil-DNA glycosylase n=1 Tax=unclassified Paenibacillus TaxID=185978 RepID=UPI00362A734B